MLDHFFPIRSSTVQVLSTFFSLSGYELASRDWQFDLLHNVLGKLRNMNIGHPQCSFACTNHEAQHKMRNFVFYVEFFINDRVCLVNEGNATPGHSSKSSLLDREFEKLDIHHKDVCTGETASFGSVLPQNRDLTQRK